jgi:ubiquinone/menaquinone biosynthesis C-methylase UbiE
MDQETALKMHYDSVANEYDGVNQGVEHILSRLKNIPSKSSVLDVGCGTGNLTLRLVEVNSFKRVVGIDLSDGVLNIARKHAKDSHLKNFEFLNSSACSLPFDDEEFDIVVSNMVLQLIPDQQKAFTEMVRVLKPSGFAVLQFLGGGDMIPEIMEVFYAVWNKVLPDREHPKLFYKLTIEMIEKYFTDLGIKKFNITPRQNIMKIEKADMEKYLGFFRLVGSFWKWDIEEEKAEQIENLMDSQIKDKVASMGYFSITGNRLLVEFTKPEIL